MLVFSLLLHLLFLSSCWLNRGKISIFYSSHDLGKHIFKNIFFLFSKVLYFNIEKTPFWEPDFLDVEKRLQKKKTEHFQMFIIFLFTATIQLW